MGILWGCLLLCGIFVTAEAEEDFTPHHVTSMPGYSGALPFKMYTGYVKGGESERLFYIYVESEEVPPSEAPISAWFNGGPGCSSLDGFWTENGPFEIQTDLSLKLRPYRWNRLSNMLYMEAPVGVGLSYDLNGNYNNSDDRTANLNMNGLNHFFELHPSLQTRDFFITGESYAGIYIPTMSEAILDAQLAGLWKGPPLKGIAVGNGCTGTQTGICGGYEGNACEGLYFEYKFLAGFSFFNDNMKDSIQRECNWTQCLTNTSAISNDGQWAKANYSLSDACVQHLDDAFEMVGHINVYNVMGTCESNDYCETDYKPLTTATTTSGVRGGVSTVRPAAYSAGSRSGDTAGHKSRMRKLLKDMKGVETSRISDSSNSNWLGSRVLTSGDSDDGYAGTNSTEGPEECLGSREPSAYMNRTEVIIDTFKARDNGFCWGVCNRVPTWHYNATRPDLPRDLYPRLIGNMKVVIYNGDVDACVPYTDNEHWTENMGYAVSRNWGPWSFEDLEDGFGTQVAGYAVEYDVSGLSNDAGVTGHGSFEFLTIKGAGHMVPDTRPGPALEMFRRFLDQGKRDLYPLYGEEEAFCQPSIDQGTEVALLVMLVFFIISLTLTVCLYLRVRELEEKVGDSGSDGMGSSGAGRRGRNTVDEDGAVDYDTRLDISDRSTSSEIRNPIDNSYSEADGDEPMTTIELNNLKQQYLDD